MRGRTHKAFSQVLISGTEMLAMSWMVLNVLLTEVRGTRTCRIENNIP